MFSIKNNIFFKKITKYGFSYEIYYINEETKNRGTFISCFDTTRLKRYVYDLSVISSRYWGHGIPNASVENDSLLLDNIRKYEYHSRFLLEIADKPIENSITHVNDSIVYFNYLNSTIQLYSSDMKPLKSTPIKYQYVKGWRPEIIKDNITQNVYSVFKTNGYFVVYRTLLYEGQLQQVTSMPVFNTEKIKINNDWIYFLHKGDNYNEPEYFYGFTAREQKEVN
ncbi:MAG: hypothetical protein L3J31_01750 [Bacteroidales bacterium]|nr:hypothetical protein [Bacteroidales bacterium]